jgi:pimeloyl-ACP methyl ester carboxylesterase
LYAYNIQTEAPMIRRTLLFLLLTTAATAQSPLTGIFQGTLHAGAANLRIVFHIASTPTGLSSTLDSPDQGATGLPTTSTTLTDSTLTIAADNLHLSFSGTLSPDRNTLTGTFTQGAASLPLTLTRVTDAAQLAAPKRPQTPIPPFPYQSLDVTYPNPSAGITLAATLTLPPGKGPFPAVLLIPGSGPHDRDETLFGHKPFLILADYLSRHGIAVLRYDDRGVGHSTGSLASATTQDLASDAEAGFSYLLARPEIDPHRTGLLGHSEGGIIAPLIAARNKSVAFVILLAGPGVSGAQLLPEQVRLLSLASGMAPDTASKLSTDEAHLIALAVVAQKSTTDPATLDQRLRSNFATMLPADKLDAAVQAFSTPWLRFFLSYDPATALAHVTCPVLALDGSKDVQVSAAQNLPAIRSALAAAGNTHVETEELPGLNHLFQPATTGSPSEYGKIDTTLSPEVLTKVSTWINHQPPPQSTAPSATNPTLTTNPALSPNY